MTKVQQARRLATIARRAKLLEQSGDLDAEAVDELTSTFASRRAAAGGAWVTYRGAAEARYGHPFWRGRW